MEELAIYRDQSNKQTRRAADWGSGCPSPLHGLGFDILQGLDLMLHDATGCVELAEIENTFRDV